MSTRPNKSINALVIWGWAASILLVWVLVAFDLRQPLWVRQHSTDLTTYGAFEGQTLTLASSWKLIASQWLHVKFPHMLFNALTIGVVGSGLAKRSGWFSVLLLGVVGGAAGQLIAAFLQPTAYMSGASQAYLALCGAALLMLDRKSIGWWGALVGVAISVFLDVVVSGYAGIKPGHLLSFALGSLAGGALVLLNSRRSNDAPSRRN